MIATATERRWCPKCNRPFFSDDGRTICMECQAAPRKRKPSVDQPFRSRYRDPRPRRVRSFYARLAEGFSLLRLGGDR